jgi:predicted membrane-bound spermidine synthase
MKSTRTLEAVYLGLAILGAVLPLAAFLPWLVAHGLDLPRFLQELFANRIAAFFGWDVVISAIVVLVAVAAQRDGLSNAQRLAIIAGTLLIGVSVGLPLLLLFRVRARRRLCG